MCVIVSWPHGAIITFHPGEEKFQLPMGRTVLSMVNATDLEVSDQKITKCVLLPRAWGTHEGICVSVPIPSCGKPHWSALIYRKVILGFLISVGSGPLQDHVANNATNLTFSDTFKKKIPSFSEFHM